LKEINLPQQLNFDENKLFSSRNILIYPNPNKGNFFIELDTHVDGYFEMQLINSVGIQY